MPRARCLAISTVAGLIAASAHAVELAPGERSSSQEWQDYDPTAVNLHGKVLASHTQPFEIRRYVDEAGMELFVRGTLEHRVVREDESGYLSFHYRVTHGGGNWPGRTDYEGFWATGFSTYFTDVRAEVPGTLIPFLERSADGDSIHEYTFDEFTHYLVVRTNAPGFAHGGTYDVLVDFEPSGATGVAHVATFRPVPEPGAGVMLLILGAALPLRRRPAASVPPPAAVR